ncbi:MAG: hypothetical protein ACR2J3_10125 [Aridibacter sp.]
MKVKIAIAVVIFLVVAVVVFSANKEFTPAEDLPREALVYAEFSDLPQFLELWNKSELKQKYLESQNFSDFQNNHLGLKLASRLQEFTDAAGVSFDADLFGDLSEKQAAIGIYDIGKLEFIYIAPVSDTFFSATIVFENKGRFEEQTLEDGTKVYSVYVKADRNRQSQQLLFTNFKGRLILATSEKLILQTLNNIKGNSEKNRLSDEPLFADLAESSKANLLKVWIDQEKLNKDYYFKRYWLMSEMDDLKNIRAGIFELSFDKIKAVERRRFLLKETQNPAQIQTSELNQIKTFVSADIPFYHMQTGDAETVADKIFNLIPNKKADRNSAFKSNEQSYFSFYGSDFYETDYSYLSEDFNKEINENPAEIKNDEKEKSEILKTNLQKILQVGKPKTILTLSKSETLLMPLFAKFHQAVIVDFDSAINKQQFEQSIIENIENSVAVSDTKLTWKNAEENGIRWRELKLPFLDWKICYVQKGNFLIFSNEANLLKKIVEHKSKLNNFTVESAVNEMTFVNLTLEKENFEKIFKQIPTDEMKNYFLNNVGSLLYSLSDIETVKIEKGFENGKMAEKITYGLVKQNQLKSR